LPVLRHSAETIKRAITEGVEPDGEAMDLTMPRWQMSERDLHDLLEFLKTLD
jgi:cytochrome c oxidase subunit 2